jgi:hypothetical protein
VLELGAEMHWRIAKNEHNTKELQSNFTIPVEAPAWLKKAPAWEDDQAIATSVAVVSLLLNAYMSRLEHGAFTHLTVPPSRGGGKGGGGKGKGKGKGWNAGSKNVRLSALTKLVDMCGSHYSKMPQLNVMLQDLLSAEPAAHAQKMEKGSALFGYDDKTPVHVLACSMMNQYKYPIDYPHAENDEKPPAWHVDTMLVQYWERLLESPATDEYIRKDALKYWLVMRTTRPELLEFKSTNAPSRWGSNAVDLPWEPRAARRARFAVAVAGVLKLCNQSAVTVRLVREHLQLWRDDLIKEAYLASDDQPYGLFLTAPATGKAEGDEWDEDGVEEDKLPWRWPSPGDGSISGRAHADDFRRLPRERLAPLHQALLADAANDSLSAPERTQAATRAMELPSCGIEDAMPLLEANAAAAEQGGSEAEGGGEGGGEGDDDEGSLPKTVASALLKGMMSSEDLSKPLRYLLKPDTIMRNAKLGIKAMQVVSQAAKLLTPDLTVKLVRALLADQRRTRAIGVSGLKELLRLLFETATKESHELLLKCWEWGARDKMLKHVDVRCVLLHCALCMLDCDLRPELLVDSAALWSMLRAAAIDPTLPAEVRAVFLCARPHQSLKTPTGVDTSYSPKTNYGGHGDGVSALVADARDAASQNSQHFSTGFNEMFLQMQQGQQSRNHLNYEQQRLHQLHQQNSKVVITSVEDCEKMAGLYLEMCNDLGPMEANEEEEKEERTGDEDNPQKQQAKKEKANAAAAARQAAVDMRCLVLFSIVGWSALRPEPSALDERIEQRLADSVSSVDPFFIGNLLLLQVKKNTTVLVVVCGFPCPCVTMHDLPLTAFSTSFSYPRSYHAISC